MAEKPAPVVPEVAKKTRKVSTMPLELQAMGRIDRILRPFSNEAKGRILHWNFSNLNERMASLPADPAFAVAPENQAVVS